MAVGRRGKEQQPSFWIAVDDLPRSEGHVFYGKLNKLLREASFDEFVERLCEPYYHDTMGRPGIPPGVYFRMLLVGYFEGLGSQRGIAWRCADSLSLREFLGIRLGELAPDHSSLTRVRDRLPISVHQQVFCFVLRVADAKGLLKGKTVGVDATTLEADAAMKSIVRRDTGEDWQEYVRRLMQEAGQIEPGDQPSAEEIARFDRQRKNKKVSNQQWQSETDPDSRITKMKDGRTLQRQRSEKVERSFAHVCETGGSRRTWLHGLEKVRKRYLTSAMARNLGLVLRHLFGIGTARSLQGEGGLADNLYVVLFNTLAALERLLTPTTRTNQQKPTANQPLALAA